MISIRRGPTDAEIATLSVQLSRIESKLEVQGERTTNKLEEHGRRFGELGEDTSGLVRRMHEQELANARQQATIDQLREEARAARHVADSKGNRSVSIWATAISGAALLLTVASQLYAR